MKPPELWNPNILDLAEVEERGNAEREKMKR
jgi:hypothetical protein